MKRKIALIMPAANKYKYRGNIFSYPLSCTLPVLYSLIPNELGITCDIYDECIEIIDLDIINVDLVGISGITSTINRTYEIAKILKKKGIYTVIGGVHASLYPEEAKRYCDTIITGLAFNTWPKFLHDFYLGIPKDCYFQSVEINLDNIKHPDYNCYFKKNRIYLQNFVNATFGCNNYCSFCIQPLINRGHFKRPINDVIKEIKELKLKYFDFIDPNITQDKNYLKKLCKELIPLKKKWKAPMTIDIANDDSLLKLLKKSGCISILIGFESINQETLKSINKNNNITFSYKNIINKIHKYKISIVGSFVLGFDNDNELIFKNTLKIINLYKIDIPRFTIITPYIGTKLYKEYLNENRIIDFNYDNYDADHVVFNPKNMTKEELINGYLFLWKKSYTIFNIVKKLILYPTFGINEFITSIFLRKEYYKLIQKNRKLKILESK